MPLTLAVAGAGTPVLFIHGCPTSVGVLDPIAQVVARTHLAIQIALPGYGASATLPAPWATADLHAAVETTVARYQGAGAMAIVGFSSGSYHALALAARGRLRVERVVCLAGLMAQTAAEREGFRNFSGMLRQGVDLHGAMAERFLSQTFRAARPDVVRAVTAWLDATSTANLADELDAFAGAPDLDAAVAALDIPILARVGALDVAAPSGKSEAIVDAAKRGSLEVVPGVGHALMYEDLDATTASVVQALAHL